ncbi:MAG: cytidine deaminase [Caldisericaceae bacterium]
MQLEDLIKEAFNAMDFAYVPYSQFKVGAALLTKSGKVFTGCNIENSSYGATVCAERVAIFKAVSSGEKDFDTIVIATNTNEPSPPCGICRQVMSEFSSELKIVLVNNKGKIIETNLKELLPLSFTKDNLKNGG